MKGEGERMVIDLQDAGETLDNAVAKSQIRLLGSSSRTLAADGDASIEDFSDYNSEAEESNEEEDDSEVSEDDLSSGSFDDDDVSESDQELLNEDQRRDRGRTMGRSHQRSLTGLNHIPSNDPSQAVFADSDSELDLSVDGGENMRLPTDSDDQAEEYDNEQIDSDESPNDEKTKGLRWKDDLSSRAAETFNKHTRRGIRHDWMKLIYSSSM